jgi:hypothetical protein
VLRGYLTEDIGDASVAHGSACEPKAGEPSCRRARPSRANAVDTRVAQLSRLAAHKPAPTALAVGLTSHRRP